MKKVILAVTILMFIIPGVIYAAEFKLDDIFQTHQNKFMQSATFHRTTPAEIFVSFSMSKESLQQWLSEAAKLHIPVAIRGFVDDSLLKTAQMIKDVNPEKGEGISVDPKSFSEFSIDKVPAVVVTNSNGGFDAVFGNVGLEAALQEIVTKGNAGKDEAGRLLTELRGQ